MRYKPQDTREQRDTAFGTKKVKSPLSVFAQRPNETEKKIYGKSARARRGEEGKQANRLTMRIKTDMSEFYREKKVAYGWKKAKKQKIAGNKIPLCNLQLLGITKLVSCNVHARTTLVIYSIESAAARTRPKGFSVHTNYCIYEFAYK